MSRAEHALRLAVVVGALLAAVDVADAAPADPALELRRALAGTPLEPAADELELAGRRHDVNPELIVAIAYVESSLGVKACRTNPRNVWGLGACGRAWRPPVFRTWGHAASYFARFLRDRWPTARSPYDLARYCVTETGATCPDWAPAVTAAGRRLFGRTPTVNYPRRPSR